MADELQPLILHVAPTCWVHPACHISRPHQQASSTRRFSMPCQHPTSTRHFSTPHQHACKHINYGTKLLPWAGLQPGVEQQSMQAATCSNQLATIEARRDSISSITYPALAQPLFLCLAHIVII